MSLIHYLHAKADDDHRKADHPISYSLEKRKIKPGGLRYVVATTQLSPTRGAVLAVSDSCLTKDGIARLWFTNTFLKNIGPSQL